MEISRCLKDARINSKVTQEELADKLGVTRQTISSWETGKSYPDIVSIIKISDIFDISLDKMLKEDKKLINNMQQKMDTVKSNNSIIFTILFAIIIFGGLYLVKNFINIPKIDNLVLNIVLLVIFIFGVSIYMLSNLNVSNFLNRKTSNKSILKNIIVVIGIVAIFFVFPLIEEFTKVPWQIFGLRTGVILILSIICLLLFKKIDKC